MIKEFILGFRFWNYFIKHPIFGTKLLIKRILYTITGKFHGETIIDHYGEPIYSSGSLIGYWTLIATNTLGTSWTGIVRDTINPVVFDIGSNIGIFNALIKRLNIGASIYSVEPNIKMFNYQKDVHKYPYALSNKKGQAILTLSYNGWSGSLKDNVYQGAKIPINTTTLDSIWNGEEVTLIKIDVDGAEQEVLEGAKNILNHTKILIIEVNNPKNFLFPSQFNWSTINKWDYIGIRK